MSRSLRVFAVKSVFWLIAVYVFFAINERTDRGQVLGVLVFGIAPVLFFAGIRWIRAAKD